MTMTSDEHLTPYVPALATSVLLSDLAAHLAQFPNLVLLSVRPSRFPAYAHEMHIGTHPDRPADYRAALLGWLDSLGVDTLIVDRDEAGETWLIFAAEFGSSRARAFCRCPWWDKVRVRPGALVSAGTLR